MQEDGHSMVPRYDFSQLRIALELPRRGTRASRTTIAPSDEAQ